MSTEVNDFVSFGQCCLNVMVRLADDHVAKFARIDDRLFSLPGSWPASAVAGKCGNAVSFLPRLRQRDPLQLECLPWCARELWLSNIVLTRCTAHVIVLACEDDSGKDNYASLAMKQACDFFAPNHLTKQASHDAMVSMASRNT